MSVARKAQGCALMCALVGTTSHVEKAGFQPSATCTIRSRHHDKEGAKTVNTQIRPSET